VVGFYPRSPTVYGRTIADMELVLESASEKLVERDYPELLKGLQAHRMPYIVRRDVVGFGPGEDAVLLGLVFIWQSITSGLTWDIIRSQLQRVLGLLQREKLKYVSVYVETVNPSERYEIKCKYDRDTITLELPDRLKLRIEQSDKT
jgi:hypothetical protein